MTSAFRREMLANLGALLLSGCSRAWDPLAKEVETVRNRTVPPDVGSVAFEPLQRDEFRTMAKWEFETTMEWEDYVEWVRASIGEYHPVLGPSGDGLLLRRQLEGDVYHLMFVPKPGRNLGIEVTFVAVPF